MKPSRYNHIVRRRGRQPALYNCRSRGLCELDAARGAIYNGLQIPITRNLMNPKDPVMERFLDELSERRMLVEESCDEAAELQLERDLHRHDRSRLSVWLQLTTRCQAGCDGCPHAGPRADLSDAAHRRLLDIITARIPALKSLRLTLWGGDPFLAWPVWQALERGIAGLSRQHKFQWSCRVIAGAVPREFDHGQLAGIERLLLNDPSFAGTAAAPVTFLTDFKRIADRHGRFADGTTLRLIPDRPSPALCRNVNGLCQSVPDYTDEETDILRRLVLEGVAVANLPAPRQTACRAVDPQSYIIDIAGRVHKCWNDVGKQETDCAAVLGDPFAAQQFKWMSWDPMRQAHCRTCNILPWCQGGCVAKQPNEDCGHWRFALRELLKLAVTDKETRGE